MGKYDPLQAYLRRQRATSVALSFREIENLIGYMLPKSAMAGDWWRPDGASRPRAVQLKAWRQAGFEATLMAGEDRVLFQRDDGAKADDQGRAARFRQAG